MTSPDSSSRCASAASPSGSVRSMSGATCRDARSGQTLASSSRAMAPFSSTLRVRSVDPVSVEPLLHQGRRLISARAPAEQADLEQAAVHREALDVALQVVAADDVEDDVDAFAVGRIRERPERSRRCGS